MSRRVHLDAVGGVAGDMFVAALLDTHPDEADGTLAAIRAAGLPQSVDLRILAHHDHILNGTRFDVALPRNIRISARSAPASAPPNCQAAPAIERRIFSPVLLWPRALCMASTQKK